MIFFLSVIGVIVLFWCLMMLDFWWQHRHTARSKIVVDGQSPRHGERKENGHDDSGEQKGSADTRGSGRKRFLSIGRFQATSPKREVVSRRD